MKNSKTTKVKVSELMITSKLYIIIAFAIILLLSLAKVLDSKQSEVYRIEMSDGTVGYTFDLDVEEGDPYTLKMSGDRREWHGSWGPSATREGTIADIMDTKKAQIVTILFPSGDYKKIKTGYHCTGDVVIYKYIQSRRRWERRAVSVAEAQKEPELYKIGVVQ